MRCSTMLGQSQSSSGPIDGVTERKLCQAWGRRSWGTTSSPRLSKEEEHRGDHLVERGSWGTWLNPLRLGEKTVPRARDFTPELCTPMLPSPWGFLDHKQEINLVESQADSHRDAFKARPVTEGVAWPFSIPQRIFPSADVLHSQRQLERVLLVWELFQHLPYVGWEQDALELSELFFFPSRMKRLLISFTLWKVDLGLLFLIN